MEPRIFISHRFDDKKIADVISNHLQYWGVDETTIFQASAPGHGPTPGQVLTEELKNALDKAKLVILVYTFADQDWSYCMWECGLATHPTKISTRTVVFQCTEYDAPKPFEGEVLVKVDKKDIEDFTEQFHKKEGFFPGDPPFAPNTSTGTLEKRSTDFFNDISAAIPAGKREDRYRWDFVTLKLAQNDINTIRTKTDKTERHQDIQDLCIVTRSFGDALRHFGYEHLDQEMKLINLFQRWEERIHKVDGSIPTDWINELCFEIWRAIDNSPARAGWHKLKSLHYFDWWFFPVLNQVRLFPDGSMEFDVYLYRVEPIHSSSAGGSARAHAGPGLKS